MSTDLEYKRFRVAKYLANEKLSNEKVYWNSDDLFLRINKIGLEDANALLRIFEKEIKEHNAKLDAMETRLRNLNYTAHKVYKSKAFKGIRLNLLKIDQIIKENPEADTYQLVTIYKAR